MDNFTYHANPLNYDYLLDSNPMSAERSIQYYLHMHNDYEILFFFDGDAEYIIENKVYALKKNSLLFIKPMVYHGLKILSPKPYERIVFNFSKQALNENQKNVIDAFSPLYLIRSNSPLYNIFSALRSLEKIFNKQEFDYLKTSSLYNALSLLHHTENIETVAPLQSGNETLNEIINYINENADQKLDARSLSDKFFVSRSWIDHSFKRTLKTSPQKYINEKKILKAQSLILNGYPIKKVIEQCNYENYSTFYRQYIAFLHHEPTYDKLLSLELNP